MRFRDKIFCKQFINGCDRVSVEKSSDTEWVEIKLNHLVGHEMGSLTLRGENDVRDLYYTLGELLRNT